MTWHLHIQGQVQGVGFRPFVFLSAQKFNLQGWVNNASDGVHIEFNAEEALALTFKKTLVSKAPKLSRITSMEMQKIPQKFFDNFQIIHSEKKGAANLLVTPDFALCTACRTELYTTNRREGYPFITCTNCGPRFSIIRQLPYDREHTEMEPFQMCTTCATEYENPLDRRYFSQTNSCPTCSIKLSLHTAQQTCVEGTAERLIERVVEAWGKGEIVAIKGIGGYLLTCDASNERAIQELRKRKYRPSKPFAVMYPQLADLSGFHLTEAEQRELQSPVAPIVLLDRKEAKNLESAIAPGLNQLGVMLPYTPLYDLLLKRFGRAIIATSANRSNAPILYQEARALVELKELADFILSDNRAIVIPQDDSVVKFTFWKKQRIILRRSRGLTPSYINAQLELPKQSVLAMGAMLKSTFSLLHQANTYISPYLGDLAHFDTLQSYRATLDHFLGLFAVQPQVILCDQHPEYPSTQIGEEFSAAFVTPIYPIQHHHAHFGAVLGENNLVDTKVPVLGVIWDGTGLGEDQQIWGGEFFTYENYDFSRSTHFAYFDFILGDKMPKEPRISALSACWEVTGAAAILKDKFSRTEWQVYHKLLAKENSLKTSSVGRIFDAIAALLGLMDKQSYEGEAAMRLENIATRYFKTHGLDFAASYFTKAADYTTVPTKSLLTKIILDLQKGKAKDYIAAKFHFSMAMLIKTIADNLKIKKIAFSGGVFQNALLVDLIQHHLASEFELFFHQELSPNDENISFGQLVCYQIKKQRKIFLSNHKINDHVSSNSR